MGNDSRMRRIQEWAHAPWHGWIKDQPAWLELFAALWSQLSDEAVEKVLGSARTLIVLPPVFHARVVRIPQGLPTGAHILQLDARLLERPALEAVAILAHELAHLCVSNIDDPLENDLRADELARKWGFGEGLAQALRRDLEEEHPRILALSAA